MRSSSPDEDEEEEEDDDDNYVPLDLHIRRNGLVGDRAVL